MPKKEQKSKESSISKELSLGVLVFIILLVMFLSKSSKAQYKIRKKQDLADYYGISRKTLNKWIEHFTSFEIENFKSIRKVSFFQLLTIYYELGEVSDLNRPLKKSDICIIAETSHRTIRENIVAEKCGLTPNEYKAMDIFPPKIGKQIIAHLG